MPTFVLLREQFLVVRLGKRLIHTVDRSAVGTHWEEALTNQCVCRGRVARRARLEGDPPSTTITERATKVPLDPKVDHSSGHCLQTKIRSARGHRPRLRANHLHYGNISSCAFASKVASCGPGVCSREQAIAVGGARVSAVSRLCDSLRHAKRRRRRRTSSPPLPARRVG